MSGMKLHFLSHWRRVAAWPCACAAGILSAEHSPRTVELRCREAVLVCEVADSEATRARGLMYRNDLPQGHGMLFVFPSPGPLSFWMKNTFVPLSIAYLDARGVIRELHDLTPHNEKPVASLSSHLQYAIEVPQGWWKEVGVKVGDQVKGLSAISLPKR
jgi:uncharacterized membrane protein (UPF0127 family)